MKKYFHELSDEEIETLLNNHTSIKTIEEQYQQPDWCNHPCALEGTAGCWSLMDLFGSRHNISKEFCKNCEESKL